MKRPFFRPMLDILERRDSPALLIVNSVLDTAANGMAGQLRSEIAAAASGDTIEIAVPNTPNPVITLMMGPISVTDKSLTFTAAPGTATQINGNNAPGLRFLSATVPISESFAEIDFTNCVNALQAPLNLGGATADANGNFTFTTDAAALGTVSAVASSQGTLFTPAASADITVADPAITLAVSDMTATTVTLSGQLTDIDPAYQTVAVSDASVDFAMAV